jgi:hypothetical protein
VIRIKEVLDRTHLRRFVVMATNLGFYDTTLNSRMSELSSFVFQVIDWTIELKAFEEVSGLRV